MPFGLPSVTWSGEENSALALLLDRGLVLLDVGGGLALLQLGHRLLQHFRMGDQIVVHDLLDLAALGGREFVGAAALRQRKCQQRGADGGE